MKTTGKYHTVQEGADWKVISPEGLTIAVYTAAEHRASNAEQLARLLVDVKNTTLNQQKDKEPAAAWMPVSMPPLTRHPLNCGLSCG